MLINTMMADFLTFIFDTQRIDWFQRWVRYADISYVNVLLKLAFTDYLRINNQCKICALISAISGTPAIRCIDGGADGIEKKRRCILP
jgi:hypothetical protein